MRMIAALIRHGDYHQLADTPSAHQPFPINERGEAQARQAVSGIVEALTAYDCTLYPVVSCSTLLRAWQTGRILCDGLRDRMGGSLTLTQTDALTERCVGSVANLTEQQIQDLLEQDPRHEAPPHGWKATADYCLPFPGAESLQQAGARVARHVVSSMREVQEMAQHAQLKLFIGHGAAFRHAAVQLGLLAATDLPRLSMHHVKPVYLAYETGGKWQHIGGEWKVRGRDEAYRD